MKKFAGLVTAGIMTFGLAANAHATNDTVYLYTWTEYVPDGLLDDFTKKRASKLSFQA